MELDNLSKHCGFISEQWSFISNNNILNVTFKSDEERTGTGFLAVWSPTTEPPTYSTQTSCDNCTFPFTFGDTIFDTCISVQDVDIQPWCALKIAPPTNEGSHVLPSTVKISCIESDSSCPVPPPQMLVISPNYPQQYPNNEEQVKRTNRKYTLFICIFRPGHLMSMRDKG